MDKATVPWDDGHGDTKGWDRASIANRSAKPYVPNITQADLTLPNEAGRLKSLALCFACAVGMTVLYVYIPLLVLSVFVAHGDWVLLVLPVAVVVFTAILYVVSTRETRELRVLAKEL